MEKQPVGPHEFVRLLTIAKVAETLVDELGGKAISTAALRNWVSEIGAVVRDHRSQIFDNYPVRLGLHSVAGEMLLAAASFNNHHPELRGHEEILRERYWQFVLETIADEATPAESRSAIKDLIRQPVHQLTLPMSRKEARDILFGPVDEEFAAEMQVMQSGGRKKDENK